GTAGSPGEFDAAHVPHRPDHYLRVTMAGVKEGDFTLVAGNPANTNRYRISESAVYNVNRGMPNQIKEIETEVSLLRKYAAIKPDYQVLLQRRIFGLANTLKYLQDVLAALKSTGVIKQQQDRERQFMEFVNTRRELQKEYGTLFDEHRQLYATTVLANSDLDSALDWLERASAVNFATTLVEFAEERAKAWARARDPHFKERFWPDLRQALLNDEPIIPELEEDVLALGFEKALALPADRQVPPSQSLRKPLGTSDPRALADAVLRDSKVVAVDTRKALLRAMHGGLPPL